MQTIGDNWPTEEEALREALLEQQRIVAEMCAIAELIPEWELDS